MPPKGVGFPDPLSGTLKAAGLPLGKLLYLSDLGILGGVNAFKSIALSRPFREHEPGQRTAIILCNDKALILTPKEPHQEEISIPGYPISIVGRELLSLAACSANVEYLKILADSLRGDSDKIYIADVLEEELEIIGEF
jgi:hypothetical protein